MSETLADISPDFKLVERIATLEEIVQELRTNQSQKLIFNGIILDGTGATGKLSAGGTTIVDPNGLSSLNNFPKGQATNVSSPSTTSTSYIDVSGSTLSS